MEMTFLDFFSGIGGFRKGLELCGMRCIGHCEIDKYADRSYRAIFDVKEDDWYSKDIRQISPGELPRANLWAGGFPCQDISCAGRIAGLNGERSGLFFEVVRLLEGTETEDRPEWIILENVKNLLSVNRGFDFATILYSLASLGYNIEYGLLNSKLFGVPQHRERVYIVAYRHFGAGRGRKVFPVTAGNGKALIQLIGGMQGQRVYDPTGVSTTMAAESGGWGGKTGLYAVSYNRKCGVKKEIDCAYTLTASDTRGINRNQDQNAVFVDLCNGNPKITDIARCLKARYNSGITNRSADNSGIFFGCENQYAAFVDLANGNAKITDVARCLKARYDSGISSRSELSGIYYGCRAALTPDRDKRQNGRRFKDCGEPAFTVTAQDKHGIMLMNCDECPLYLPVCEAIKKGYAEARCGDSINISFPDSRTRRGRVGKNMAKTLETGCNQGIPFVGCGRIRRLTPREAWRLQGFTDDMFDRARTVNSDNQLYRQAGNSVTIPVVYAVGQRIAAVQNELDGDGGGSI